MRNEKLALICNSFFKLLMLWMPADSLEKQRWQNEDRLRDHRPPQDKTSNSDLLATHEIGCQVLDSFANWLFGSQRLEPRAFREWRHSWKVLPRKNVHFVLISFSRCNVCRRCIRVKNNPPVLDHKSFYCVHYSLWWARTWLSSSWGVLIRQQDSHAGLRGKHERILKDTIGEYKL